jgi:hypothetical protein
MKTKIKMKMKVKMKMKMMSGLLLARVKRLLGALLAGSMPHLGGGGVDCINNMDTAEKIDDNDFVNPTSSMTSTMTSTPPFNSGDHVILPCNVAGLIPCKHHAIVVSVGQDISGV